jgi:hypothetical protein
MVRVYDEKPDRKRINKVSCENCAAKLEYVPNDVKEYNGRDYGGGPDGCKWIDCPKCGKKVVLESW